MLKIISGVALITMNEALMWTDGRYFLQAEQQLKDGWKLMRLMEDPNIDVWMADVSSLFTIYCSIIEWLVSVRIFTLRDH